MPDSFFFYLLTLNKHFRGKEECLFNFMRIWFTKDILLFYFKLNTILFKSNSSNIFQYVFGI